MTYILRLGQIQKKIEDLQEEIDTLEGGSGSGVNAEVQAAINELQDELDDLTSQYTNLLTQYSNISNTVTTIDGEVTTLQNDLNIIETLHTDLNDEVTIIGNELDTLRSSHISLSSQYTTTQNDLDILESNHTTLVGQYNTLNTKANSIQADLDTLEASHVTLQSSNTGLISQYTTLNTRTTNTQNDLDTLEASHITLQSGYSTLTTTTSNLGTQYTTLNNKADSIQADLDTLESSHATLQSAYTTVNNKVTIIDGEVDTLQSGYTALDTQLDALEIKVDNLIASINSSGINWSDITPATIPTTFNPVTHASRHIPGGTDIIPDATTTISGLMSNVDKTKLNGIANSATLNSTDAFLLNRTNHTGTQAISTITSLQTTLDGKESTITNLPVTKGGTGNTSIAIDNILYSSAANTLTATPITSYVRTLLDDIDASTFRTTLGLGSIATQASSSVSITGGTISIPTITANAIERGTSGTLNIGATANNTTLEIGSLATVINVGTGAVGKTINIGGHTSDILNITGSVVSQNVTNTNITDKLITLNKGGAASSADGSGFEIEENASITSYFKTANTRNSFDLKVPAKTGILRFTPSSSAFTHEIITANTANRTFTLPDVDTNLNSQAQNLVYASPTSGTGTMSIRSLVSNDIPVLDTAKITTGTFASSRIPLATSSVSGAISKEATTTWTPVLEGSSVAGNHTYVYQIGRYYLLGNACFAWGYVRTSAIDAAIAGNLQIGGLPFPANNTANFFQTISVSQYSALTLSANFTQVGGRIDPNTQKILLIQSGSGQAGTTISVTGAGAAFILVFCAMYIIN